MKRHRIIFGWRFLRVGRRLCQNYGGRHAQLCGSEFAKIEAEARSMGFERPTPDLVESLHQFAHIPWWRIRQRISALSGASQRFFV
ncbi:MAG TPA: hypothetical protein VJH91_02215 [Candidatus Paceibacterota bacterium]